MSAPKEDTSTASTFGANLEAGFNGPNRQKFAEIEVQANKVLVVGVPQAGAAVLLVM